MGVGSVGGGRFLVRLQLGMLESGSSGTKRVTCGNCGSNGGKTYENKRSFTIVCLFGV
jgi:hypothetical protein